MSIVGILAKFRVRTKIIGIVALIGLMVLGGVFFTTSHMRGIDDDYTKFLDRDALSWVNSARIAKNVIEARYYMLRLSDNAVSMENKKNIEPRIRAQMEEALTLVGSIKERSPAFATQADTLAPQLVTLQKMSVNVINLALNLKEAEAKEILVNSRPIFDKLATDVDQLRVDLEKSIKAGSDALTATTNQTIRLVWIVMVSIIGAGVLLGFLVALLGIANPLSALIGVLQQMAKGEDIEIVGADRKDEVGDTARAVTDIKMMLAEKARAEAQANADRNLREAAEKAERDRIAAEEKIEQDKRAVIERTAAEAKVMADLDAAVGGIVNAAMAGDFSQRVPLEGKQGVIRNLAESMNAMCENVGKVMEDLVGMLSALSDGNLTRRIDANYQGTFATLKDSANSTAEKLSETVARIKTAADEVTNASAEISMSTTDLSQRTEEQAASLEETSASMEQISVTVKKNAENAQQANALTAETRGVADRSGEVVASTVEAMSRIEESSRKIADIIGVIDEIARQTNLLALNAAVEAARAGDAGRGFAVVASEVRSLAQRSSQAAKDIKDLITSSSTQVQEGVDLVNRTGTSLNEIVSSIRKVADIVGDIAVACAEQSTGLDQINKALTQMDEVTQQNSALVEENAATAKTLEQQAGAMTEQVSFFKLHSGGSVARMAAAPIVSPVKVVQPSSKRGIVGRMQSKLATAFKFDQDTEEF